MLHISPSGNNPGILGVATRHGKELFLQPLFSDRLNMSLCAPPDLNTDLLGTFTGEISRQHDIHQTLLLKCDMAHSIMALPRILASEGSFFPHPEVPFITINEEWVILKDYETHREYVASARSTDTNFAIATLETVEQLLSFAQTTGFPEHQLILRPTTLDPEFTHKGIFDRDTLIRFFNSIRDSHGIVRVETDMRAFANPRRQKVITKAAEKLIDRLLNNCPACGLPGFGTVNYDPGLPCALCGFPTSAPLRRNTRCETCGHLSCEIFPDGKTHEDPTFCNYCNP